MALFLFLSLSWLSFPAGVTLQLSSFRLRVSLFSNVLPFFLLYSEMDSGWHHDGAKTWFTLHLRIGICSVRRSRRADRGSIAGDIWHESEWKARRSGNFEGGKIDVASTQHTTTRLKSARLDLYNTLHWIIARPRWYFLVVVNSVTLCVSYLVLRCTDNYSGKLIFVLLCFQL